MPIKNSKLILGIGRDKTERYSSLNKLLTAPFNDSSTPFKELPLSRVKLLIKYSGSLPVNEMSFDVMVWRLL